jgi:hypothetical protein
MKEHAEDFEGKDIFERLKLQSKAGVEHRRRFRNRKND